VTNGEWVQGVDGKPRFVLLVEDPVTKVINVKDVTAQPPSFIDPTINFDAGQIVMQGGEVLVKLMDNPSVAFDAKGRVFSRGTQPVVGVTYYHSQAWVLTDASGRLALPTDLQQEAVASNFGRQVYGTATGERYTADGRKLGHFEERKRGKGKTADVNDPRYPAGPFDVYSMYNVWRWMQADPVYTYPHSYGLRGGSWSSNDPELLHVAFRSFSTPDHRNNFVGLSPVALPGLPK
jgi:formylglycine-generating enzyme required for sulfatase activity